MTAGRLNKRIQIERRSAKSGSGGVDGDPYGRAQGGWSAPFGPRWAGVSSKTGGETFGNRIEGRTPVEVLVRLDPETKTITLADRCLVLAEDLAPLQYLNIRSVAPFPPDPDAFLLLTCEAGGPNG